ncbi:MAG TPA: phosphoribosylformylglycinamidine cyclo-ligase [Armatimonadota bacterium]|nr:phosphoribosylformylglycinamidine cyclo-ligase [Armatimonadota bacterium]
MDERATYKGAGVDIDAGNEAVMRMKEYIKSTFTPGVLTEIGTFGGMYELPLGGVERPVLVSSIDSVGTKLKVAFMMNKHDTMGHDLVNHCVNDILVQGAKPLFFLDYFGTGQLIPTVVVEVVKGLSEACRSAGCALIGGETAEMPGMYLAGEYDLAGCIVGLVDRSKVVDGSNVLPGDVLVGIASNGLHTNGYSLVRHIFFERAKWRIDQRVPELGMPLGEELLKPHRSYLQPVHTLLDEFDIHGMAHITGGGFYDNVPRALPADCQAAVDRRSWEVPTIFRLIQEMGAIAEPEMYRTFNMGIGYVLVAPKEQATAIVARLAEMGETSYMIGEVRKGSREVQVL